MKFNPMLPRTHQGEDPTGYWMSEKLDGVFAEWNGVDFISKAGKVLNAPQWFKDAMPQGIILNGEIFGGRGKIQETAGKVKSGDWTGLRYVVFDVVANGVFEDRITNSMTLTRSTDFNRIQYVKCESQDHFNQFESGILANGGEGVVIRKARSLYVGGKTANLIKIKRLKCDEGEVAGHTKGKGRNAGKIGALIVEYNGALFNLSAGLNDDTRENPAKIGSKVTFSFTELTDSGKPRGAVFLAVRDYE